MRAGWPINVGDLPTFEPGPSGNLYVFSVVNATTTVTVLTPAGKDCRNLGGRLRGLGHVRRRYSFPTERSSTLMPRRRAMTARFWSTARQAADCQPTLSEAGMG